MKWLIGLLVVLAALGGVFWYAALDASAPAEAGDEFDLAAYRQLLVSDAPETLPSDVRVEFVGSDPAPSFATEAGAFGGERLITYTAFQIVGPSGNVVVDGAVDADTLNEMSKGAGQFCDACYQRLVDATQSAAHVLITHEHIDHVMSIARHPNPEAIAPHLRLTHPQLSGLPQHARNGQLAPAIASVTPVISDPDAHRARRRCACRTRPHARHHRYLRPAPQRANICSSATSFG